MTLDHKKQELVANAVEVVDFDRDGKRDVMLATNQGVLIRHAEDDKGYSDFHTVQSGNTVDLCCMISTGTIPRIWSQLTHRA